MIKEFNEFERDEDKIRAENEALVEEFCLFLDATGLSEKTVLKHARNVLFYINEFLLYDDVIYPPEGIHEVSAFFNDWFVRKCLWASANQMKDFSRALKKFYGFLAYKNLVSNEDCQALSYMVKTELPHWLTILDRYDHQELYDEKLWEIESEGDQPPDPGYFTGGKKALVADGPSGLGTCFLCEKNNLRKGGVVNHLKSCMNVHDLGYADAAAHYVLKIEGSYSPEYWVFILLSEASLLTMLDDFLRAIWLECCGHLSAFIIDGVHYSSHTDVGFGDEQSMDIPLKFALQGVKNFKHIYDFGSTTQLDIQIVDRIEMGPGPSVVHLIARNNAIHYTCSFCKQTAIFTDPVGWGDSANYCKKHTAKSEEPELLLPLVNSPRTGVCGYTG